MNVSGLQHVCIMRKLLVYAEHRAEAPEHSCFSQKLGDHE